MKVATGDGGADVTQVIAAIDWVVQHRYDQGMNVRVINLAYGTGSTQGVDIDPLAHAVENAWRAGIVVVTAAGNDGLAKPSLLMPARTRTSSRSERSTTSAPPPPPTTWWPTSAPPGPTLAVRT
jgi:subtilisin family serine protease